MITDGTVLEHPAAPPPAGAPAAAKRLYTYEELVAEMPETSQPCELWDGELILSPSLHYFHQKVVYRFHHLLNQWVTKHKLGEVVGAPIDMVLSSHRVMQPDVAFIAKDRLDIIKRVINGPVVLAVEVISLGNRNRDRIEKRDLYEQYGIKEYWIIDPEAETVEVLHLENGRYQLAMRCRPGETASSRLLPGFEVAVETVFRGD